MASCPDCGYRYHDPGCQCERLERERLLESLPDLERRVEKLEEKMATVTLSTFSPESAGGLSASSALRPQFDGTANPTIGRSDQETRDMFAAHALPEEMRAANEAIGGEWRPEDYEAVAKEVFDMVDALMAERARRLKDGE